MNNEYEQLPAVMNLAGKLKYERFNNEVYVVVPITILRPGVLNGSHGPILYEWSDIENSASQWKGVPITLNHPDYSVRFDYDENDPKFLGKLFDGQCVENKLTFEGWLRLDHLRKHHHELLNRILAGKKINVSTGLRVSVERSPGVDNLGRYYQGIARNYRPDHLAILPDSTGACSIDDGCGIHNERNEDMCTCKDKVVCNDQTYLLDVPVWEFENPLEQSKNYGPAFERRTPATSVRTANAAADQADLLGTPEWEFENPLKK